MREQILALLATLPAERGVVEKGDAAWLRCPVHSGGTERTPSFKIALDGEYVGSHYCYACKIKGPWNETVRVLGFPTNTRFLVGAMATDLFTDDEEAAMLGRKPKAKASDYREPWPRSQDWRGVPGPLIVAIGGKLVLDRRESMLRLPALIRKREAGYIDCKINPAQNEKLKYINSADHRGWSKDALFPYDFVRSLEPDVVALVEGPRDALVTLANGLPALATLGATSWSDATRKLLRNVGAKTIVLMLDPDDPGEELRRTVYRELAEDYDVRQVRLPSRVVQNKEGKWVRKKLTDPADLDERSLLRVLRKLDLRLPRIPTLEQLRLSAQ